ncbi:MAG: hypothetical protein JW995_08525 [Melioribacteraceae bacterium]|nr:hypothetical protein [Melioribacteraceae bacterium]
MQITRLYTGNDGESYNEEINIPLSDAGDIGRLSDKIYATGIIFRETGGNYDYDFHNAPQRQFIINLDGEIEIETSCGQKKILKAGNILLAEDITGRGHRTKSIDGKKRKSIFVTLE